MWSNSRAVAGDSAGSLTSDEGSSSDENADLSDGEERRRAAAASRSRPAYRNSVCLSRKWVRKASHPQLQSTPQYVALATSPCGCLFAAACGSEVALWLRRRNLTSKGRPWEPRGGGLGGDKGLEGGPGAVGGSKATCWDYQPATVLSHEAPVAQVAWGRGPGNQNDYLLTLEEDGK